MESTAIKTMLWGTVRCSYWSRHFDGSTPRNFKVEVEKADSSATSLLSYQNARCHIPELQVSRYFHSVRPYVYLRNTSCVTSCQLLVKWWRGKLVGGDAQRKNDQTFSVSETSTVTECTANRVNVLQSGIKQLGNGQAMPTAAMYSDREFS